MKKFTEIINHSEQTGIYLIDTYMDLTTLRQAISDKGFLFFHLDGSKILDTPDMCFHAQKILDFPSIPTNLDGFYDWLRDMSWWPQKDYVIVYTNFHNYEVSNREDFYKIIECFVEAIDELKSRDENMYLFLQDDSRYINEELNVYPKIDSM